LGGVLRPVVVAQVRVRGGVGHILEAPDQLGERGKVAPTGHLHDRRQVGRRQPSRLLKHSHRV
jgi:hypothetical protein